MGGNFGTYGTNDKFQVVLNKNNKVEYKVNGVVRYTSTKSPSFPLGVDAAFHDRGGRARDIKWIGNADVQTAMAVGAAVQFTKFQGVVADADKAGQLKKLSMGQKDAWESGAHSVESFQSNSDIKG